MRKIVDFEIDVSRPHGVEMCGISMRSLVAFFVGAFLPATLFAKHVVRLGGLLEALSVSLMKKAPHLLVLRGNGLKHGVALLVPQLGRVG
ncbi:MULTISPECIES: hypothetical protein [Xanthomonas]|uniref:hypothetical protein n=1 Tax=Xanthomonas TaxID=338 RepID=UPI001CEE03C7|nr:MULTISPECIES: hypothetical protein [Xanthomonas]MDQ7760361.1 hypothetical protein [Xanthomonas sontii]UYK74302.1 hypothetical protein NG828_08330 [Xanthomonas sacchari]